MKDNLLYAWLSQNQENSPKEENETKMVMYLYVSAVGKC